MQRYRKVRTCARLRKIQVLLLQRTLNELRAQLHLSPIQFNEESDSGHDVLIGMEEENQEDQSRGNHGGAAGGAAAAAA